MCWVKSVPTAASYCTSLQVLVGRRKTTAQPRRQMEPHCQPQVGFWLNEFILATIDLDWHTGHPREGRRDPVGECHNVPVGTCVRGVRRTPVSCSHLGAILCNRSNFFSRSSLLFGCCCRWRCWCWCCCSGWWDLLWLADTVNIQCQGLAKVKAKQCRVKVANMTCSQQKSWVLGSRSQSHDQTSGDFSITLFQIYIQHGHGQKQQVHKHSILYTRTHTNK